MYDADFFSGLVTEVAELARLHRERCEHRGIHLVFLSGRRTFAEQIEAYSKGRARTPEGWIVTDAAKIVTLALPGHSPHCRGIDALSAAYDCAPLDSHEKIDWSRLDLFKAVADLMPEGLVWGGTFPIHDLDHFELKGWRDLPLPT